MEMWCPDDKGRDSWDWVGPPAWERAASTPQSGVEWRLLACYNGASPDCIIVVVVAAAADVVVSDSYESVCMSTTPQACMQLRAD